jgi:hypothetical protein
MTFENGQVLYPIVCEGSAIMDFIQASENILAEDPEYKNICDDNKFKHIKVYGTHEEPYFQATSIYNYLYPAGKNPDSLIRNLIENKHYFKQNAMVFKKSEEKGGVLYDGIRAPNFLTELGLMVVLCKTKSKFAITFQELLLGYIKTIRKEHNEIHKKTIQDMSKVLMETNKKLILEEELRKSMDIELCNITNKKTADFGKMTYLKSTMVNGKKSKDIELEILRSKYMKPFRMYSVNIGLVKQHYLKSKKITKKKITKKIINYEFAKHGLSDDDDSNSCDDEKEDFIELSNNIAYDSVYGELDDDINIVEYYGFKSINLEFLKESQDTEFYIYLPATTEKKDVSNSIDDNSNFHFIGNLYMLDQDQYKKMMNIIVFGEPIERQELPNVPKMLENETDDYKNNRMKLQHLQQTIVNNNKKLDLYDKLIDDGSKLFTIDKRKIFKITGKKLMDARLRSFEQKKPASIRRTRIK